MYVYKNIKTGLYFNWKSYYGNVSNVIDDTCPKKEATLENAEKFKSPNIFVIDEKWRDPDFPIYIPTTYNKELQELRKCKIQQLNDSSL